LSLPAVVATLKIAELIEQALKPVIENIRDHLMSIFDVRITALEDRSNDLKTEYSTLV